MREHDINYCYICGVSKRLNHFVFMRGGWFSFPNHPEWLRVFMQEFFAINAGFDQRLVEAHSRNDILLWEELKRYGIKSPPKHFVLRRRGIVQNFKPVKKIPIPSNAR